MNVRALVFDLDDTLFAEREFVLSGFAAADQWLQAERQVTGFSAVAERLFGEGVRGHIFDEALRQMGVRNEGELISQMVAVYRAHRPARLTLLPDAQWALTALSRRYKLGLITDGYGQTQRNKIAGLGLDSCFSLIVITDDLGREHWKPSPLAYRRVMQTLGMAGEECVYVGDNPTKDFVAANRLGWLTVQVRRPGSEHAGVALETLPADHRPRQVIGSLHELVAILPSDGFTSPRDTKNMTEHGPENRLASG